MRLNKTLVSIAVVTIMTLTGTHAHSQLIQDASPMAVPSFSGNTGSFTPNTIPTPNSGIVSSSGMINSSGFVPNSGVIVNEGMAPNAGFTTTSGVEANTGFGSPMISQSPVASQMQYASQPVGTPYYSGQTNSGSYGPLMIGKAPAGCANCDLTPVPTAVPHRIPVTPCCGGSNFGRLGIPALTTPIRADMPPIGKAYGRPMFGKWTGF